MAVGIFHAAWKLFFPCVLTEKVNCENTSHALFATSKKNLFGRYLYPFYIVVIIIIIGRYLFVWKTVVMHQKSNYIILE